MERERRRAGPLGTIVEDPVPDVRAASNLLPLSGEAAVGRELRPVPGHTSPGMPPDVRHPLVDHPERLGCLVERASRTRIREPDDLVRRVAVLVEHAPPLGERLMAVVHVELFLEVVPPVDHGDLDVAVEVQTAGVRSVHRGQVALATRRRCDAAVEAEAHVPRAPGIEVAYRQERPPLLDRVLRILPTPDPRVQIEELLRGDVSVLESLEPVLDADVVPRLARVAARRDPVHVAQVLPVCPVGRRHQRRVHPLDAGADDRGVEERIQGQRGEAAPAVDALGVTGGPVAVLVGERRARVQSLQPLAVVPVLPLRVRGVGESM
jgi:hypothetical protein